MPVWTFGTIETRRAADRGVPARLRGGHRLCRYERVRTKGGWTYELLRSNCWKHWYFQYSECCRDSRNWKPIQSEK